MVSLTFPDIKTASPAVFAQEVPRRRAQLAVLPPTVSPCLVEATAGAAGRAAPRHVVAADTADTADTAKAWGFAAEQWGRFVSQMWKSHCHLVFLLEIDFESQWNCPKINQNDICFAS